MQRTCLTRLLPVCLSLLILAGCSRTAAVLHAHEDRALMKRVNPEAAPEDQPQLLLELPGAMAGDTGDVLGGTLAVLGAIPAFVAAVIIRSLPEIAGGFHGSGF